MYICNCSVTEQQKPMRRDVFQAIADPTRREIVSLLTRETLNLNAVSDRFDISRPAISKHIKILTECGLVVIKQQGRERFCEVNIEMLDEVSECVARCTNFWNNKLDALERHLSEEAQTPASRQSK